MPIYKYQCSKCGKNFEAYQNKLSKFIYTKIIKKDKLMSCPFCKAEEPILIKTLTREEAKACDPDSFG
ncbi:MAG: FmdB family zinc ribbon protein [bacterium]